MDTPMTFPQLRTVQSAGPDHALARTRISSTASTRTHSRDKASNPCSYFVLLRTSQRLSTRTRLGT
eukprot:scaffold193479_cov17-Prasinocladus_malaysianus.AAC.1